MMSQKLIKAGSAFKGADGEVRHVYMIHKPGNGYSVSWDSIPRPSTTMECLAWWDSQKARPHGYMPMRKFQKWASAQVDAKGGA